LPIIPSADDNAPTAPPHNAPGHVKRFAVFSGVGAINTGVDFAVFAGLAALGVHVALANIAAFLVANLGSYFLNARITFRSAGPTDRGRYLRFLGGHGVSLGVSTLIVTMLAAPIGAMTAKLIAVIFSLAWNYGVSAFFVFRDPNREIKTPAESP